MNWDSVLDAIQITRPNHFKLYHGKDSHQPPRLCQAEQGQWVEGKDPAPVLSTGEAQLGSWVQCWAPQYKTDRHLLEHVQ